MACNKKKDETRVRRFLCFSNVQNLLGSPSSFLRTAGECCDSFTSSEFVKEKLEMVYIGDEVAVARGC